MEYPPRVPVGDPKLAKSIQSGLLSPPLSQSPHPHSHSGTAARSHRRSSAPRIRALLPTPDHCPPPAAAPSPLRALAPAAPCRPPAPPHGRNARLCPATHCRLPLLLPSAPCPLLPVPSCRLRRPLAAGSPPPLLPSAAPDQDVASRTLGPLSSADSQGRNDTPSAPLPIAAAPVLGFPIRFWVPIELGGGASFSPESEIGFGAGFLVGSEAFQS